ncbi:PH domain-containing protein [Virgibacillus halodenitrificans]|uniref:PH domain-containing protein n=1 Tax=Virgibacillus halodenitrificans TaxID=1482 RepID=UPI00076179A7
MRADAAYMKAYVLTDRESIQVSLRCAMKTFIYRQVYRPGMLVATERRLIFVADSTTGNELIEVFEYRDINDIRKKRGLLNSRIVLRYKTDIVKFSQFLADNDDLLVKVVKEMMVKNEG